MLYKTIFLLYNQVLQYMKELIQHKHILKKNSKFKKWAIIGQKRIDFLKYTNNLKESVLARVYH